jgi:hypothetical protein
VRWLPTGYSPGKVRVRFTPTPGGRLVATEVHVADDEPLSVEALRMIPLPRLERWVNRPDVRQIIESAGEAEDIRRPHASARITPPARKGRQPYPESFYRRVAEVVSVGWSAPAIAEDSGVPTSTVNRWIKGARERGMLPPSRSRKGSS